MSRTARSRSTSAAPADPALELLATRHLQLGWWSLLAFLTLGAALEGMHGFRVGWYLDAAYETRRLVWTLAHAHGALLALVQIAFAVSLTRLAGSPRAVRWASPCLALGGLLIPAGFGLGGVWLHGSDPGLGILLVPMGAALLFLGVLLTAWSLRPAA